MKKMFALPVAFACLCAMSAAVLAQEQRPVETSWVKQRARTPRLEFYVQVIKHGDDRYAADAIRVVKRSTREVFQEIRGIGGMDVRVAPDDLLTITDANFDDRADLAIAFSDGGAGPNSTDHFYLANGKTGMFELHAALSALPQVTINADRSITSTSRGGCCLSSSATYRFVSGMLTMVASTEERLSGDGKSLITRDGIMSDGKMRYSTKSRAAPEQR